MHTNKRESNSGSITVVDRMRYITHRSISPGTNPQMALVISNPLRFSKELTFK